MTIKIAVLGTGWGTRVQVPAFRAAGLEVSALWARTAEKARQRARELNIPFATDDPQQAIEHPEVDLVAVTTPPHTHCEHAVAALKAGKHVLCENPIAMDTAQAKKMLATDQERPQQRAFLDYELRFLPSRRRLKQLVADGWIGEPFYAAATFHTGGRLLMPDGGAPQPWGWWSEAEKCGGTLGAIGSHMLDALGWTLGRPIEAVQASLATRIPERPDAAGQLRPVTADEQISLQLDFGQGVSGNLEASAVVAGPTTHQLLIAGTGGTLRWEPGRLWGCKAGERTWRAIYSERRFALPPGLKDSEWTRGTVLLGRALVRGLERRVASALTPAATFEEGLKIQRVLDAARQSAKQRSWVDVRT